MAICRECGETLDLSKGQETGPIRYGADEFQRRTLMVACSRCGTMNKVKVTVNAQIIDSPSLADVGEKPTYAEMELVNWASEAAKGSIAATNDSLRQMITLITALLGGAAGFMNQIPAVPITKIWAVAFLVAALGAALVGSLRYAKFNRNVLEEIKAERARGLEFKARCLVFASVSLFLAFGILLGGMAFWHQP